MEIESIAKTTTWFAISCIVAVFLNSAADAQDNASAASLAGGIEPDGTVNVPAFQLPPSSYLSDEAKKALPRKPTDPEVLMDQALAAGRAGELRGRIGDAMAPRIKHFIERYPATMQDTVIAGCRRLSSDLRAECQRRISTK